MSSSEAKAKKALKPNKKAIKNMNKILNGRKKKNELEGLDEVIFSDNEEGGAAAADVRAATAAISVGVAEKTVVVSADK